MQKINVLVTGTGSLIGQAIIKSIKKHEIGRDIYIIGCDYFPDSVGSFWCDKNYLLPDLLNPDEIDNWKESIANIIADEKIQVVMVGVDFELDYFAEMKESLEKEYGCTVIVSNKNVIEIGNDKYLTYKFLKENGINAPYTELLENVNACDVEYPIVIKPRIGARSRGVHLVKTSQEFEEIAKECFGKGYIVQKAIGTMQTEYSCGILYWNGEFQNSIVLKRVLKEGNTALAEYNDNEEKEIVDYLRNIGDALKPFGSCNLQLRLGDDGKPYLFEINPRFSGTTYMRALFGYNEVAYLIGKAIGMNTVTLEPKKGKVYRFYDERLV